MGFHVWNGCGVKIGAAGRAAGWEWLGALMARKAGTEEGGGRLRGEVLESSTSLLLYSCCPPVLGAIERVLHP